MTCYTLHSTPAGRVLIAGGDAVSAILFTAGPKAAGPDADWRRDSGPFVEVCRQLDQYFARERCGFDLVLKPAGTPFQLRVWEELRRIGYGETISYGELARRIGNPAASRAVGLANGSNPISIVIPCHRVIGGNGRLTGYGGGLEIKRLLLDLEASQKALFR